MKWLISSFLLGFSFLSLANFNPNDLDTIIQKVITDKQPVDQTGVAISVFKANEILFSKGYGYRDQKNRFPVDPQTLFAIGSTTKAMTTFGIGQLIDQGKIQFTDSVSKHIPSFDVKRSDLRNIITIEDILSHQVGLPRHDVAWYLTDFSRRENFEHIKHFDFNPHAGMGFRESFQYNNFMFLVAGILIEEISRMSWEDFIQNNILTPLKMSNTHLSTKDARKIENLAIPYNQNKELNYLELTDIGPAGSIYSNVVDMSKWLRLHLRKGLSEQNKSLINESTLEEMYRPRIPLDREQPNLNYAYGLGWMINSTNPNKKIIFHGGNIDGFFAMVMLSHDLDLGVVALVNQSSSSLNNDIILAVLNYFGYSDNKHLNPFNKNIFPISPDIIPPKHPLVAKYNLNTMLGIDAIFKSSHLEQTKYLGEYSHLGYGDIKVELLDGELFLKYYLNYWKLTPIDHEKYDFLTTTSFSGFETQIPFKFNVNSSGDVISLEIPFEGSLGYDIEFKRKISVQ